MFERYDHVMTRLNALGTAGMLRLTRKNNTYFAIVQAPQTAYVLLVDIKFISAISINIQCSTFDADSPCKSICWYCWCTRRWKHSTRTTGFNSGVRYGRPSNSSPETAAFIWHWRNGALLIRVVRDRPNTIGTFIQQYNTSTSVSVRCYTTFGARAASFRSVYSGDWLNYCNSWFAASLLRRWHKFISSVVHRTRHLWKIEFSPVTTP